MSRGDMRLCTAGAGLGLALIAPHAMADAAQWTFEPGVQLGLVGETNPRLVPGGSTDAHALMAGADLSLKRATELSSLSLQARATQRRYEQATALDRLDASTSLQLAGRGERFTWQTRAMATRDTTLTSELGLSGLTGVKRRHESIGGSLDLGWSASERVQLSSGASVQFDMYPGEAFSLVDYRYRLVHAGAGYALGPRSTLTLTAQRGELAVSGSSYESTDSAVMLQYQFKPSERLSISLAGGPSWVDGIRSERGESFNASVTRKGERVRLSLSGGRRIAPTGRGYLTRRDDATFNISLQLTEQLASCFGATYIRSRDVLADFGLSLAEVRYRRATAGLGWQMRRGWSLGLNGGYADQTGRGWSGSASGLDLRLGFNWSGGIHVW